MKDYGERFREERIRLRLKQSEIAKVLGCSNGLISYMESDTRPIRVIELYRAYEFFGIDIGFGKIFKWIDNRNEELLSIIKRHTGMKFFEKELEDISNKKYEGMDISLLEKIDKILAYEKTRIKTVTTSKKETIREILPEEQKRLNHILKEYLKKDGNIERALKLLEIAVQ